MPSLAEAYDRQDGEVSRERLILGTGLFGFGALLAIAGLALGTTGILPAMGFSPGETLELAGTLAGLGVPAVLVGIFAVLPADRGQRALAAIGASLAVFGVLLFRYVYWEQWYDAAGTPTLLTLLVAVVYFVGTITTFWSAFTAVATFKRRNDPGGTVTLTISQGGTTRTVEVAESSLADAKAALSSVGVFGDVDDLEREAEHHVQVTTADTDTSGGSSAASDAFHDSSGATHSSDGGATDTDIRSPMDDDGEVLTDPTPRATPPTDRYCGNCAHFEYVRTNEGIQPYCGQHDELMDDMDACEVWEPNR